MPLPRMLVIFGIVTPLAILVGLLLSSPTAFLTLSGLTLLLGVLLFPVMLRWHHLLLVLSWNAAVQVFFLPGQPDVWILMSAVSLTLSVLAFVMDRENKLQHVPILTWSLALLAGVVVMVAWIHGGIGLRAFGSAKYGGKGYVLILAAIVGYFALSVQRIPPQKIKLYVGLFFLSMLTIAASDLIFAMGSKFYGLYYLFPPKYARSQAEAEMVAGAPMRFAGLGLSMVGPFCYMLARYGVSGVLDLRRPWRLALLLTFAALSLSGGFRSVLIQLVLIFFLQFWLEGLIRTKAFPILLGVGILGFAFLVGFSRDLPEPVQRAVSFLPVDVDPSVRFTAAQSVEWRLRLWRAAWEEVPKHPWLGKGLAIDPSDVYLMGYALQRGTATDYEWALMTGAYHNGLLSILLPFGLVGVLAFTLFILAALKVLYNNYRYSTPGLRVLNAFLLAYFLARVFGFWVIYGALSDFLPLFTGLVGFSVALNGGMRTAKVVQQEMAVMRASQPAYAY